MPKAVFRADASPEIGVGHVIRCLALAVELERAGWVCAFASRTPTLETVPVLGRSGFGVRLLRGDAEPQEEAQSLHHFWPEGVELLVADHYQRHARFEAACRPWAKRILAIDDLADRPHDCDVLLDQTAGRTAKAYAGYVPEGCHLLLGSTFALLRPEFAAQRELALARRASRKSINRILVSFGGGDSQNVTAMALQGIALSGFDMEIDVVVGNIATHLSVVRGQAQSMKQPANIHMDVRDMAYHMAQADLAIGAQGSTAWERCCLGLPALTITMADNQCAIGAALARRGAILDLGSHRDVQAEQIAAALRSLVADPDRLEQMAICAAEVCDGLGAQRVAMQLGK